MENRPKSARSPDESASAAAAKFVMLAIPCAASASSHRRQVLVLRGDCLTADPLSERQNVRGRRVASRTMQEWIAWARASLLVGYAPR